MNNKKNQLFVEGRNDQRIFEKLLHDTDINNVVDVLPPSQGEKDNKIGDGVNNLIKILPVMIKSLEAGNRLAIVVDADYFDEISNKKGSFLKRREEICEIISRNGYIVPEYSPSSKMKGEIFPHKDNEIPPIGLWIMPNHCDDGMMEDLIFDCINPENGAAKILSKHIEPAIDKLLSDAEISSYFFNKEKHLNKVKLETWVFWQNGEKSMGGKFGKKGLFNMEHENIKNLKDWLKRVFVDDYGIED